MDPKGFLKYNRETPKSRKPQERIKDYKEIYEDFDEKKTVQQATRCMDCGVPFCHNGCPLGNIIPEFNEAVHEEDWHHAFEILNSTNNFPEFTGRICPAPCESACVLGINESPVAIEHIEKAIAEIAFEKGYIRPQPPVIRSGKKVAIVGSGPAGLAAAVQLNKAGHQVTVFEKSDRIGGLLRYGIPDFKLEKWVIERRIAIMENEGIRFKTNAEVGGNIDVQHILDEFDAMLLCGGSLVPRDLNIPGRELKGIHFAMEYLEQCNRRIAGDIISENQLIDAKGKHVVVIGGGDTGSDCVGNANRQGAASVTQLQYHDMPPLKADLADWPNVPLIYTSSSSHEEGCQREWAILTKMFIPDKKNLVNSIQVVNLDWQKDEITGKYIFRELPDSLQSISCDLAFIAIGYAHPQHEGLLQQLGVQLDERGNVKATPTHFQTNVEKVFAAGDMRRGQSLVVWAISEGREAARSIDAYLCGQTLLEGKTHSLLNIFN
ncbi:MAG: glutamate synthase subunit beta [Saprospiraceae bacterium]|nr:glutamate synthase subunit beta [Saprospiraceae bacterium]